MASELHTPYPESQDEMAKLAQTVREKILLDEPLKEDGLIDQLERAATEILVHLSEGMLSTVIRLFAI